MKRHKRKYSKANKIGSHSSYPDMCVRKTIIEDISTLRHQAPPWTWAHSNKEHGLPMDSSHTEARFYKGQRDSFENKGL